MDNTTTVADLFSVKTRPSTARRYTLADTCETAEGGRVGVGVDGKGNAYLVHEIGRATEAVALGAVATAVAAGAIPPEAVAAAFAEAGTLPKLVKAVAAASK